jgi:hypothetical protein
MSGLSQAEIARQLLLQEEEEVIEMEGCLGRPILWTSVYSDHVSQSLQCQSIASGLSPRTSGLTTSVPAKVKTGPGIMIALQR